MEEFIVKTKDPKKMLVKLHKDDVMEVDVNTLSNPKHIKVGDYLATEENNPRLKIVSNNGENIIGIIQEHIVIKYTFKEIWDLFIKFLFRTPKINNIRFKIIK